MSAHWIRKVVRSWGNNSRAKTASAKGISRRNLLKSGLAIGTGTALAMSGCKVVPLTEKEIDHITRYIALQNQPQITTSLREGKSVRDVVESYPHIGQLEIGFQKSQHGKIKLSSVEREELNTYTLALENPMRSNFHTHLLRGAENAIDKKIATVISPGDLLNLLNKYKYGSTSSRFKFQHLGIVAPGGKLIGYYSFMLGKKLEALLKPRFGFKSQKRKGLERIIRDIERAHELAENNAPYACFLQMERCIKELKWLGLKVRATGMPGYRFKDGYFQPK